MRISGVLLLVAAIRSAMAQANCAESSLYSTCAPSITASICSNNACYCASIQSLTSCYLSHCPGFVLPTSDLDAVGLYCSTTSAMGAATTAASTPTMTSAAVGTGSAVTTAAVTATGTTAANASASTSKAGANGMVLAPGNGILAVVVIMVAYL